MNGNEICSVCQDGNFVLMFSAALTGSPNDNFVHGLTQKAVRGEITNEQYFGELILKYGDSKVAQAVLTVMREKKGLPQTQVPDIEKPRAQVLPDGTGSSVPLEKAAQPPDKIPTGHELELMKGDKTTSGEESVCGVCVGRPLLGMLLTFEEWFTGEDRKKIDEIAQQLERGTKTAEDVIAELYVSFGIAAVNGVNRILRDFNTILEKGKEKALKQRPDLEGLDWD